MELSQSKKSKNTDGSRVKLVDTSNSDDESYFRLGRNVNLSSQLGLSSGGSLIILRFFIGSLMRLDSLKEFLSLGFICNPTLFSLFFESSRDFAISFFFLAKAFRFGNV